MPIIIVTATPYQNLGYVMFTFINIRIFSKITLSNKFQTSLQSKVNFVSKVLL